MEIPMPAESDIDRMVGAFTPSGLVNGPYGGWLMKKYSRSGNDHGAALNELCGSINQVTTAFNEARYFDYSLGYGLTGFIWSLHCLGMNRPDSNEILDQDTLQPLIESECLRMIRAQNYDLFQGAHGVMMYLMETQDLNDEIYNVYVKNLRKNLENSGQLIPSTIGVGRHNTPFLGVNLGIPHGVAGCILILLKMYQLKPEDQCRKIIGEAVSYLLGKAEKTEADEIRFSYSDHPESEFPPLAWCYGDLCSGYTLLKAGKILKDPALEKEGFRMLDATLDRTDFVKGDLSMCHGPPCIAYLYCKAFQMSGMERYMTRSNYWKNQCGRVLEELEDRKREAFLGNTGLIYGYPGMFLALKALNGEIIQGWDSWMLI